MTTIPKFNASNVAITTFNLLVMVFAMLACMVVTIMGTHIQDLNKRIIESNKAWAAVVRPVSEARMVLPVIETPEDLANALDAYYVITPVKMGLMPEKGRTEIVIRREGRSVGDLVKERDRIDKALSDKPSF